MGFRYSNWVYANAPNHQWASGLRLVLLSLADQMNDSGECWPSHEHTASRVGLSSKQVRRHINTLKQQGLIAVVKNKNGGRSGQTPIYRALFDPTQKHDGNRPPTDGSRSALKVLKDSQTDPVGYPQMSIDPSHRREPNHHRTLIEPSINQKMKLIKNKLPKELNEWRDYVQAGEILGLRIRENDPIESQSEYQRRVQNAYRKKIEAE
jgi:biotin operon repressor